MYLIGNHVYYVYQIAYCIYYYVSTIFFYKQNLQFLNIVKYFGRNFSFQNFSLNFCFVFGFRIVGKPFSFLLCKYKLWDRTVQLMCTVRCVLCTVYCALGTCTVRCLLCTVHCVLFTVHFVLCTVHCAICACEFKWLYSLLSWVAGKYYESNMRSMISAV
jgi:hypothetical protein